MDRLVDESFASHTRPVNTFGLPSRRARPMLRTAFMADYKVKFEVFEGPRSFFSVCPNCEARTFFPDYEGEGFDLIYVEAEGASVPRLSPVRRNKLLADAAAERRKKKPTRT